MDKIPLRKTARLRRSDLARRCPDFDRKIAGAALDLPPGTVVAGYAPIASEADPAALMDRLAANGHPLALPCIIAADAPLTFRRYRPGDTLVSGAYGIPEPPPAADEAVPDVVLVPLLAFDAAGWRLGYGGGYYDRTLAELRTQKNCLAIGIAFAGQEVAALPHDAHDQRLDGILTENGWRQFRK